MSNKEPVIKRKKLKKNTNSKSLDPQALRNAGLKSVEELKKKHGEEANKGPEEFTEWE